MSEANKAVVRRWVEEGQSQHRLQVIDEIFAPDIVNHDPEGGMSPQGADEIKQFFGMMFSAFPDFSAVIEDQIAEGDKVVTRKTISGTHQGDFMGIPATGKRINIRVIDVLRVRDGKCTDHWSIVDQFAMMQQLGLIPGSGEESTANS